VIGSDEQAARVALVARYAETLRAGLAILGIDAPERM
jgi:arginyl-tRNA synthetase